jgi:hypothetical protein
MIPPVLLEAVLLGTTPAPETTTAAELVPGGRVTDWTDLDGPVSVVLEWDETGWVPV